MKLNYITPILFTLLLMASCTGEAADKTIENQPASVKEDILGRWKLTKEEQRTSREKGVQYANQPTNVVLHIQKNGYFIIYDTFIDPAWKSKGLPLIQRRSKGQWQLEGKQLTLNHLMDDSSYTEELEITSITDNELVTKGKDKKANIYKTYGK
ncbi:MAG TPA: lipocalin family protein [Fluviicola sp.]|nr:lipocalin family protein [Fluviicola sp.]